MKTEINIKELVAAFRAKEIDRMEAVQAEQQKLTDEASAKGREALALLEAVWPSFLEVFSMIPCPLKLNGEKWLVTQKPQTVPGASAAWAYVHLMSKGGLAVEIGIGVKKEKPQAQYILHYPNHGYHIDGICPMYVDNPADILVALARFVGKYQAKNDQKS